MMPPGQGPILELRVAITGSDYEELRRFYCDALGVAPAQLWSNDGGRAALLDLGRATLEIFDEAQARAIDQIEVGRRVSGPIRFALRVSDLQAALDRVLAHGGILVHPPVATPWGDLNARVQDPSGMHVTLFQAKAAGGP
jgi:predicted enzyme related to lactoylglutathione lyase